MLLDREEGFHSSFSRLLLPRCVHKPHCESVACVDCLILAVHAGTVPPMIKYTRTMKELKEGGILYVPSGTVASLGTNAI